MEEVNLWTHEQTMDWATKEFDKVVVGKFRGIIVYSIKPMYDSQITLYSIFYPKVCTRRF